MISVKEEYALKLNPVSSFKVAIYDIKVIDAVNRDAIMLGNKKIMGSDAGDPYVAINFDDIHSAKTKFVTGKATTEFEETKIMNEAGISEEFDSDEPANNLNYKDWYFMYQTKYPKKLDRKYLTIVANDHDYIGKDDLIGEARVDLMTLAAGPVNQDLTLWDGDKEAGRVEFKVKMKQIACPVFRFDEFKILNPTAEKYILKILFNKKFHKISNKKGKVRTEEVELTVSAAELPAIINMELSNVSFKTLYDNKIEIQAIPKEAGRPTKTKRNVPAPKGKKQDILTATFSVSKIMASDAISVRSENILDNDPPFSFTLRAYGLPIYSQMKSGVNYGYEIKDGAQEYPNIVRLPIPHCSKKETVTIEIEEKAMNAMENAPKEED